VVKANLIVGFPGETRREMWETVRFGLRLAWMGVEDLPLFPFVPYPGSELYDGLRAEGMVPPMSNEYFAQLAYGDFSKSLSFSEHVSSQQLRVVRVTGMVLFLLVGFVRRPWRLARMLRAAVTGRSVTVVELRLVEAKLRLRSAFRRGGGRFAAQVPRKEPATPAITT